MNRLVRNTCLLQLAVAFALCTQVSAWEIELKGHVTSQAAAIRLGDIGRITGLDADDAHSLAQIVLSPGPSRSYSRSVSNSQIRKILRGRGVVLDACRFTGAPRSIIVYDRKTRPVRASQGSGGRSSTTRSASPWDMVRTASYRAKGGTSLVNGVEGKLADLVTAQLLRLSGEATPWDVRVTISSQGLRDIPAEPGDVRLEELVAATEGHHQLVAIFSSETGEVRVPLDVQATRMVQLAIPVRPLNRGEVINVRDVELRFVSRRTNHEQLAERLDEVVGRQVHLPLRAGEPIPTKSLKKPILIKRREEVEIVAQRGVVRVKMKARAIDDGALDDIIAVEKLDGSRKRLVARVVGVQQVEVCASSASAHRIAER